MSSIKRNKRPWELIEYPSSDGKRMAENTKQARWIIHLHNNLRALFLNQEVFVASDLLWYPVEGRPDICTAPDTMIVLGRPDGDRSSYKQWREENMAPQVVFEVLSPSNSLIEMAQKQAFYTKYGAKELIVIDPGKDEGDSETFVPYNLQGDPAIISDFPVVDWTSSVLGIRFRQEDGKISVFYPDGKPFKSFDQIQAELEAAEKRVEEEQKRVEKELQRAEAEKQRAEAEKQRANQAEAELEKLRARLRELED